MALITCPQCGKQISDRAVKCPHCGFVPGSSEGEQSVLSLGQQEQNTAPKKTHKKLWIVIMALLAVMAVFWFLVIKGRTKTKAPSNSAVSEYYNKENPKKTQPTSPNDEVLEIKQVLNSWVEYHNEKNVESLMTLYADQVEYFLANYSKEQVRNSKQNALDKNPQFQMTISNVNVEKHSSYYKVSFDKLVQMNSQAKAKTYPSYLHIQRIGDSWKIIKESDLVTEEKQGQQNSQNKIKNYVVIDGSELRLRLGPSTSADTFKWKDGTNRHPKVGEKFKYLGESGDFYQIDFHGHNLWVSKSYTHIE